MIEEDSPAAPLLLAEPETAPSAPAAPPAPPPVLPSTIRRRGVPFLVYGMLQTLQLVALHELAPRFFWLDDAQRQFGPMAWWLGRNLRGGRPPLMEPDLGMAGNLVADMQYGALDPLHWVFQAVAGRVDNFLVLSWGYGSLAVLLLGAGTLWVLLHYQVQPVLAVAGALAVASSGFFLWYGSSWWPLMWSMAWLPLLWAGLASRRWPGAIVTGLAVWALLTSGNPYAFPFALLIVVGQCWERLRERGSFRALLDASLLSRAIAGLGGVIVAAPTLLTTIQMSSVIQRETANPEVGNVGFAVPNLADVVLGGMTLMGQTNAWNGDIAKAPAMATLLIALPLLALVSWRRAIRAPGVLTALILTMAAVVATQLPTTLLVFRFPIRYLVFVQCTVAVLALLAVSAAPVLNRKRLLLAGGVVVLQFLLSLSRAPVFFRWHLLSLAITLVALGAAVVVLQGARNRAVLAAGLLWPAVFVGLLVGARMMVSVQERMNDIYVLPDSGERPFRVLDPGYELGVTVNAYRDQSYATDQTITAIVRGSFGPNMGWSSGIFAGNSGLIAGLKPGFGSLAVWQDHLDDHWCRHYEGDTCSSPAELLATVPDTDRPWIDVLSSDTVVLEQPAEPAVRTHFDVGWDLRTEDGRWIEYARRDRLPGRITVAQDVDVSTSGWTAGLAYAGEPMDTYVVSTGADPGSLIFRIPWWPGLRATVDGRPQPVSSVDGSVLRIDLAPGLSAAELDIFFDPIGARISTGATLVGVGLILAAAVVSLLAARRKKGAPAGPTPTGA